MRAMSTFCRWFPLPAVMLAAPAPPAAENIAVRDFAGGRVYTLSQTPPIRRGVTTFVQITKNFIDLVPFNMVSISGAGATISNLSNGNNTGTGFIAMSVTVPNSAALGAQITLSVGLSDRFTFRVVSSGLVAAITKNPDPSTIAPGTAWIAAVGGIDLGSPVVDAGALACHTVTTNRRADGVDFTLRRNATCSTSSFLLRLTGSAANDPPSWATSTGAQASFTFSYAPPGVTCTSAPNIGAPQVTQPTNQQLLRFGVGTPSPAPVTIAWQLNTNNGVPAPNNEWVITQSVTVGGLSSKVITNVTGTSTSLPFAIPGTHSFSIRAKNCGQSAPVTQVTFSTQYQ